MRDPTPTDPEAGKNSMLETRNLFIELVTSTSKKLSKYLKYRKNNSPWPLAILKIEPM